MAESHRYTYEGPVLAFDRIKADRWKGETTAVSEAKARSNLIYQFKRENGLVARTKITLPGKIKLIK